MGPLQITPTQPKWLDKHGWPKILFHLLIIKSHEGPPKSSTPTIYDDHNICDCSSSGLQIRWSLPLNQSWNLYHMQITKRYSHPTIHHSIRWLDGPYKMGWATAYLSNQLGQIISLSFLRHPFFPPPIPSWKSQLTLPSKPPSPPYSLLKPPTIFYPHVPPSNNASTAPSFIVLGPLPAFISPSYRFL